MTHLGLRLTNRPCEVGETLRAKGGASGDAEREPLKAEMPADHALQADQAMRIIEAGEERQAAAPACQRHVFDVATAGVNRA